MTNINTNNFIGIEKGGVEINFLGRLLWYTISELKITREQLQIIFAANGIDEMYLPNPINVRDSFRRATKEAEQKRIELSTDKKNTKYLNLMVREVHMTNDIIIRQLVREIVDGQNKRLDYCPIYELSLEGDIFKATPLIEDISDIEKARVEAIALDYEDAKIYYNARYLRDIINKILWDCRKVAVRPSGGVYFTPIAYENEILALQQAVSALGEYTVTSERSKMWSIPVIDVTEQREMIKETLEEQVKEESKALIKEMADLLHNGRKITTKTSAKYIDRVNALQRMVKEYEDMLETEIINTQASLEAALKQAMSLLNSQVEE